MAAKTASAEAMDVSIIIPCFNRAALIGRTIESALAEGPEVEVIVVDDGSSDGSWDTIQSFAGLRSIRTGNRGPSAARNSGLAEARGQFVRFLDSDDRIIVGSTGALLAAARQVPEAHIPFGDAAIVDEEGRSTDRRVYGFASYAPGPLERHTLLSGAMPCWLPLFRRSTLLDAGGFNERFSIGEDYELAIRLASLGHLFVHVPATVYELCDHGDDRLSRTLGAAGYRNLLHMFSTTWKALRENRRFAPTVQEREAMASFIWIQARDASREGLQDEASKLFALASEIGGIMAYDLAPLPLRLLYRLFDAYTAERLLELFKGIKVRLTTP